MIIFGFPLKFPLIYVILYTITKKEVVFGVYRRCMNVLVPDYYDKFKCIADKCRHSCCIGWEIDIDPDTLEYYESIKGDFAKRLKSCISTEGDSHFVLSQDERCPFLNKDGLCDIILELGEESLCEICAEHPRFRNYYSSHSELGLGLCCEEAARIILSKTDYFSIIPLETDEDIILSDEEKYIFGVRDYIFKTVSDRNVELFKRFELLMEYFRIPVKDFSCERLAPIFLSLERLDEKWTDILKSLTYSDFSFLDCEEFRIPLEQLFCYFVYRYFAESVYDDKTAQRLKFSIASCFVIGGLWYCHKIKYGCIEFCDMIEYARMYSSEVEYSEENISEIIDII